MKVADDKSTTASLSLHLYRERIHPRVTKAISAIKINFFLSLCVSLSLFLVENSLELINSM